MKAKTSCFYVLTGSVMVAMTTIDLLHSFPLLLFQSQLLRAGIR
jgi:hypothetical protein